MAGPAKRIIPVPQFVVTSEGALQGTVLTVERDEQVLGRRDNSDLHLPDSHVSRAHAVIRRQGGAVWVEDLGSTGGTYVNGEPITGAQALRHGDEVRFGTVETRFEDRASAMEREDVTETLELPPDEVEEAAAEIARPLLSPRQQEVLGYLKEGLTNPEIAELLGVTERTVKAHCQEVFDRLGARNRTAAVATAMRMGLLDEE